MVTGGDLLNEHEAAEYLNCSPAHLRNMRSKGDGPSYCKLFRYRGIRYSRGELDAFVASRVVRTRGSGGGDGCDQAIKTAQAATPRG